MKRMKWGVLSTAKIGLEKVIPAMQQGHYCEIAAIASRELEKAKDAAVNLNIPKAYGSYAELLADPEIEAVYIPVPNHLHVPLSIQSLEAGKHVLCEKPIALNAAEAQKLLDVSQQYPELKIMEAFMYRHHPQIQMAKQMVEQKRIGEMRNVHTAFTYYNVDPDNVRNKADIGGGGLLDIGCYCINLSRFLFGSEPKRLSATVEFDPELKTDRMASVVMEFETGTATFTCSTQLGDHKQAVILGTKGKILIENPFTPAPDVATHILHQVGEDAREHRFDDINHYTLQGDLFSLIIQQNKPVPVPLEDAVANMKVIDAVFESGRTGKWVEL